MCPYFVHNPKAHQEASCKNSRYKDMSRLRQHIDRVHIYAPECGCCPNAVRKTECAQTIELLAGISLKSAPYHNQPRRTKWQLFFHALFPHHLPIPSPYEEQRLTLEEERDLVSLLAGRLGMPLDKWEKIYFDCRSRVHQSADHENASEPSEPSIISAATSGSSDIHPPSQPQRELESTKRRRTSHSTPNSEHLALLPSRPSGSFAPSTPSSKQGSSQQSPSSLRMTGSHYHNFPSPGSAPRALQFFPNQATSHVPNMYPTALTMGYPQYPVVQYPTAYVPQTTHPQAIPYPVMPGASHAGFSPQTPPNPNPFSTQFPASNP